MIGESRQSFQDTDQVQAWHEITNYGKGVNKTACFSASSIRLISKQANQRVQELEDTFKEPTLFVVEEKSPY